MKCKNYYVTWDQQNPRGCKAYQFKTTTLPSQIVLTETGSECQAYIEKFASEEKSLDLNDEKLW